MKRYLPEFSRHVRLAVGLFALLASVLIAWMIFALEGNRQIQAEITTKMEILEGLKRRAIPDLSRKEAGQNLQFASISAASETIAASILQKYVLERLEQVGGHVLSVQAEPNREGADATRRLTTQLAFEASIEQLQKLLFGLEIGSPFIFVDSLLVQPSATAANVRPGDRLRVSLTASSFWQSDRGGQ